MYALCMYVSSERWRIYCVAFHEWFILLKFIDKTCSRYCRNEHFKNLLALFISSSITNTYGMYYVCKYKMNNFRYATQILATPYS